MLDVSWLVAVVVLNKLIKLQIVVAKTNKLLCVNVLIKCIFLC